MYFYIHVLFYFVSFICFELFCLLRSCTLLVHTVVVFVYPKSADHKKGNMAIAGNMPALWMNEIFRQ